MKTKWIGFQKEKKMVFATKKKREKKMKWKNSCWPKKMVRERRKKQSCTQISRFD